MTARLTQLAQWILVATRFRTNSCNLETCLTDAEVDVDLLGREYVRKSGFRVYGRGVRTKLGEHTTGDLEQVSEASG
jgi:hypothetical protein